MLIKSYVKVMDSINDESILDVKNRTYFLIIELGKDQLLLGVSMFNPTRKHGMNPTWVFSG